MKDLMREMCLKGTRELMAEQLRLAQVLLPKGTPAHETWLQAMEKYDTIRTLDDALYFIFCHLVANPGYANHVTKKSNPKAMRAFIAELMGKFDSLLQGRAPGGKRATTAKDKEFQQTTDFVMAMRARYPKL